MLTVREVVDRVGPAVLRILVQHDSPSAVTDVVIAEKGGKSPLAAGDLVLGVAVNAAKEAVNLIQQGSRRQAAAVLLKSPVAATASVHSAAQSAGISLVEVDTGTAWAQLVWQLRTVLDAAADEPEASVEDHGEAAGLGDLFRLADAVAAVIDAPVTIEDANSRVLAYSTGQDRTDPARVSTIIGRRIPDDVLARFRSKGVFRELSRGRSTIFVPEQRDGTLPRLIVPIRMGGQLLGSMWAVVSGEVSDERAAAFADAGPVAALHLLRRKAHRDAERTRSADRVRRLLDGADNARVAATSAGLSDGPHRVIAMDAAGREAADELASEGLRLALWERITAGVGHKLAVTDLHGVLYAVVPEEAGGAGWTSLRSVLDRTGASGPQALVAVGSPVPLAELSRSRSQASETLDLLRSGVLPGWIADYRDVWAVLALRRTATAAAAAGVTGLGPIAVLREYDEANGTEHLRTLYEWLRHLGDPRSASSALRVHPNTLRYRMRRVVELSGVDLDDADVRLALLVQLTALYWA
jgi:hypothetical protein